MIVKRIKKQAQEFVKREAIMVIAIFLAIITSFYSLPKISYIDFSVLSILFSLMLVITGLKKLKVLDYIAVGILRKAKNLQEVAIYLVMLTFFFSMLVTNDVALLTFVPLSLAIGKNQKKDMAKIIIWQTIAANLGSTLTPMGNPQNLFLYSHYGFSGLEFLRYTLPVVIFSFLWLCVLLKTLAKEDLKLSLANIDLDVSSKTWLFTLLLIINVLTVFHVFPYAISLGITIVLVFLSEKKLFYYVDYSLLVTFLGFFVFIGNLSQLDFINIIKTTFLGTSLGVYISSIAVSQFISNVPAAMLLAGFTDRGKELLLGVNVGGLGTLIASMASVISYKLYVANNLGQNGAYLKMFLYYNILGLIIFAPLVWFIVL